MQPTFYTNEKEPDQLQGDSLFAEIRAAGPTTKMNTSQIKGASRTLKSSKFSHFFQLDQNIIIDYFR